MTGYCPARVWKTLNSTMRIPPAQRNSQALKVLHHLGTECFRLPLQLRQQLYVALLQLLDAAGELLGQPIQFVLWNPFDGGKPFVLDDWLLNSSLGKRRIADRRLSNNLGLCVLAGFPGAGFAVDQG